MNQRKIIVNCLRQGQRRPYEDSIYDYDIEAEKFSQEEVKLFCTKILNTCEQEHASGNFNGHSNFPFGLNSFFKFEKYDDNKYHYKVCKPFTG